VDRSDLRTFDNTQTHLREATNESHLSDLSDVLPIGSPVRSRFFEDTDHPKSRRDETHDPLSPTLHAQSLDPTIVQTTRRVTVGERR
jgi:hypothetical protein